MSDNRKVKKKRGIKWKGLKFKQARQMDIKMAFIHT